MRGATARYSGRNASTIPTWSGLSERWSSRPRKPGCRRQGLDAERVRRCRGEPQAQYPSAFRIRGAAVRGVTSVAFGTSFVLYMLIVLYGRRPALRNRRQDNRGPKSWSRACVQNRCSPAKCWVSARSRDQLASDRQYGPHPQVRGPSSRGWACLTRRFRSQT